jgi:hypothetical protein
VLPANPFGDLSASDLGSFIECTLYETSADADVEDIDQLIPIHVDLPVRAVTARRSSARRGLTPQIAVCAACAVVGLAGALVARGRVAVGERPAVAEAAVWGPSMAVAASRAPSPPPPPTAPVVEPIGPELPADAPPPQPARGSPPRLRPAILIIGSSPPGAAIVVNGEARGATPVRLEVPRFEEVEIEATLAGYLPWKKTVYVRQAETRVGTSLTPVEAETEAADDDGPATQ